MEDKPIIWINEEIQKKILEVIPQEHKPIFVFLFTYGCRPGEARALMWDAIDFANKLIYIKRTFSHRTLVETPKEGKWKVFPMLPHIEKMLKELYKHRKSDFVFSHKRSDHYGEELLPQIWKEACKKLNIQGVSLYAGVRHSFAMQRLTKGYSYEEVGACLGHSDIRTTRRYGRLMAQSLIRVFSPKGEIIDFEKYLNRKKQSEQSENIKKVSPNNQS